MSALDRKPAILVPAAYPQWRRDMLRHVQTVLYHGSLIGICLVMILPLIWMLSSSLKNNNEIFVYPPRLLPAHPLWENYPNALQYIDFWRYFANSFFVAGFTVMGTLF